MLHQVGFQKMLKIIEKLLKKYCLPNKQMSFLVSKKS